MMQGGRSSLEKLFSQIDELAHVLCDEAGEEEIFFADRVFKEKYLTAVTSLHGGADGINADVLEQVGRVSSLFGRGMLCRRICDTLGIYGIRSVSTFFDEVGEDDGVICYVKNHNSDNAYLSFANEIDAPRAIYADDFTQACENVYYGRSTYCILPVWSSSDGRLGSFRNLQIKYALKTVCVTAVGDGENETLFALMKRELEIPKDCENAYLDVRLQGSLSVFDVIFVADVCGMRVTDGSFTDGGYCDLTLTVSEEGICGFLTYLNLEQPDFVAVGIYKRV